MGMRHAEFLSSPKRVYGCGQCHAHLSTEECIVSRQFNGQHGKAYLFDAVVNVYFGDAEDRHMTTGLHTVRDIRCNKCAAVLGWKYVSAGAAQGLCEILKKYLISFADHDHTHALLPQQDRAFVQTEKYKEGKFILEKNIMVDVR